MTLKALALAGALAVLGLPGAATAQAPQPAPGVSAQTVKQKESLVRRMLTDSPVAARIAKSHHEEAKKLFAAAQENFKKSQALIQAGDNAGADQQLNEAMWNLGKARQLVPDTMYRAIEQRVRYAQLLESVDSLRNSYVRHLTRAKARQAGGAAQDAELERVTALTEEAKSLANSEQLDEALERLQRAERALLAQMNRVLAAATLDYSQKFETPAEEYAYELDRNRSYLDLIPVALAELKPSPDAKRLVDRYIEQNRHLTDEAVRHAVEKDYKAALKDLRTGTGYLQRALLAAGLVLPQEEAPQQ